MDGNCKIDIMIETKKACPDIRTLRAVAEKTLELEGVRNEVAVNFLFVDNEKIRELNRKFLNRDESTDVISFGANPAPPMRGVGLSGRGWVKGFIGEVVISAEMAEYNARRFDVTFKEEVFLYMIHGILHLLGYDDRTKGQRKDMEKRQNRIMGAVCGTL
jgi:probable rRNA maturation factor